ncbi:HAD-IA family hydrolase [Oscillatoria sp. CS-180]|uniref:HAD family hydrolase n=1 Tax=Oscillatoria sp. CS-180 TaxID=3021720 RepID=UPI00232DFD84|nr:HAD-IA family hydrolase [Oscillatoria sp. CS-180]MDB9529785.1 HAD-IA family hydrolase [Oscillatoria sp. CS-180]
MLQAVIFDLDGTLADTDPVHLEVWRDILEPHGYTIDETFFKEKISGRLNEHLIEELLPQLSQAEGEQLAIDKEAKFRSLAATRLQRMPGFNQLYDWIKGQALKTAVVTNAPRANAEFVLNVLDLETAFDLVLIAGELPRSKPDPLPYQTALEQLGIVPATAVVFEDSKTGIQSAVAAQIPTIGVASSHKPDVLYSYGASLVIDEFADERLKQFGLFQN